MTNDIDSKLVGFNGVLLHPSLDIKDGILVLGFRYRSESKIEDAFLVTFDGSTKLFQKDDFVYKEKKYSIDKSSRKLAWIEVCWGLEVVNSFIEKQLRSSNNLVPVEVFKEIVESSKKYIELEKDIDYVLLTAWIIGTYFYPIFSAYPMLNLKGPKGSGKSQCLNFLRQLCFNAIKARPTLAALGDTVDSLRGTYLIDQADSLDRKGSEDLLDILTDSYKKGGGKRRVIDIDKNKSRQVREFETYSPKAFASIKELPQDLRDRCLAIPLIRSSKNFHDPDEDTDDWRKMRDKLYRLLILQYPVVASAYEIMKVGYRTSNEIVGRQLELWLPIETMLAHIGMADYIAEAKKRFKSQYGFTEYEPSDLDEKVITAIYEQLRDKEKIELTPKAISEFVGPETWGFDNDRQRAAKVGWVIKGFNLSNEKLARTKDGHRYLFTKDKIEKIYNSYFKPSEKPTPIYIDTEDTINTEELFNVDSGP